MFDESVARSHFGLILYTLFVQLRPALQSAIEKLEAEQVGSSRMNAEVLLMFVLGCDRAYLYGHPERDLTPEEQTRYDEVIAQRASGFPSQYITGHQEFWGLDFVVSPAVLIPRPETEHLIETVLELVSKHDVPRGNGRPKIIDVGTGSGAIAIALAKEFCGAEIHAVDVSAEALEIAQANAARLGFDRISFRQSDVLEAVARDGSYDFVVSNPPYVGLSEADKVQDVVKKFEPKEAVFAGEDGLDVIRRLIPQARDCLREGGWLLMEIGFSMSRAVCELLDGWDDVHVVPDLAGIPRIVVARRI